VKLALSKVYRLGDVGNGRAYRVLVVRGWPCICHGKITDR
jgi:hypothetical protein